MKRILAWLAILAAALLPACGGIAGGSGSSSPETQSSAASATGCPLSLDAVNRATEKTWAELPAVEQRLSVSQPSNYRHCTFVNPGADDPIIASRNLNVEIVLHDPSAASMLNAGAGLQSCTKIGFSGGVQGCSQEGSGRLYAWGVANSSAFQVFYDDEVSTPKETKIQNLDRLANVAIYFLKRDSGSAAAWTATANASPSTPRQ